MRAAVDEVEGRELRLGADLQLAARLDARQHVLGEGGPRRENPRRENETDEKS